MNRNLLAIFFFNYETNSQIVQLYRLKNSKLANVYTFEITDNVYKMNGQECTEEEYNDEYTLLLSGVIKDMGTDFGFDDDSIDAALGNKSTMEEGYAAVVNSYLKQMEGNANVKSSYSIMDVNGDEVPELFVSEGVAFSPSVDVFSWNGCVVPVGNFGTDGTMYYYPTSGELKGEYHAPSYTAGCFYKFNEKFKFDEDFDAASYFSDCFGVMTDENSESEKVLIRAYGYEPYYLRDLPLHHSQREIHSAEEYSDFELRLKITSDFKSKLLSRGEWIEILEPKSLAEEIVEWHQKAINRYKK
jgi:hypothetical protein